MTNGGSAARSGTFSDSPKNARQCLLLTHDLEKDILVCQDGTLSASG